MEVMRNDARPIGEDAHDQSPVASHDPNAARESPPVDQRDSVTHDRQSHIANQDAEVDAQRRAYRDAVNEDPAMPTGDSTLNTKI